MWGLVTIFQGLLELLCPSYTVCKHAETMCLAWKTSIFTVSELFLGVSELLRPQKFRNGKAFRKTKNPKLKSVVCMLFMYMSHLFYHKWKCLLMNIRMQSVFGVFSFYFHSIITKTTIGRGRG